MATWTPEDEAALSAAVDAAQALDNQFSAMRHLAVVLKGIPLARRRLVELDKELETRQQGIDALDAAYAQAQVQHTARVEQLGAEVRAVQQTLDEVTKLEAKRRGQVSELDARATTLHAELKSLKAERDALLERFRG